MAELAPEPDEDFRMMRLVVSATFFPSYGLVLGSGELIRRPVADRAFSAVARLLRSGQVTRKQCSPPHQPPHTPSMVTPPPSPAAVLCL